MDRQSGTTHTWPAWLGTGIAVIGTWIVVLSLTVPQAIHRGVGDYGFFTAVADRLRAGDVLYEQIWDNKDPLVFYSIAGARTFGAGGAWALELAWVLLASVSLYAIGRRSDLGPVLSTFVAFVAAPIVVVGMPYFMGSTHLPGVSLTLMALALAMRGHLALAGIPVAVLLFFKFIMLPLALAVVVTVAVVQREPRRLIRFALSMLVVVAGLAGMLALRGELGGFASAQLDNILYSQSPIVSAEHTGLVRKIAQHIVILVNPHIVAIEVATMLGLVFAVIAPQVRGRSLGWRTLPTIWWTAAAGFVVSTATIAVTGKWFHHAEIYVVSSTLVLIAVARTTNQVLQWREWVSAGTALLLAYPLSGATPIAEYREAARALPVNWQTANRADELTVLLRDLEPTSAAFVGMGNALPRSGDLEEWSLACRHVGQRPFNPEHVFTETLACLPQAELVVIGPDYGPDPAFPAYSTFVEGVEALMASEFTCEQARDFRLCRRDD